MEKKNHGLADNQEGEIILNESGTSFSTDEVEGVDTPAKPNETEEDVNQPNEQKSSSGPEEKDITD